MQTRQYQPRGEEPTQPMTANLPPRQIAWLDRRAAQRGISRGHLLRLIIDREIHREPVFDDREAA